MKLKFDELVCVLCIYDRYGSCRVRQDTQYARNVGCGEGKWLVKRHNGEIYIVDWSDYWYEYFDPDNIKNPATGKYDIKVPPKWEGCQIINWRKIDEDNV